MHWVGRRKRCGSGKKLARVEDAVRVEGLLEGLVEGADVGRQSAGPPTELGPMPCSPVIAPPQAMIWQRDRREQSGRGFGRQAVENPPSGWCGCCHHRRGRSRQRQAVPALNRAAKAKVFEAAAHDNVFVKFGQAGIAEGVGELAADLPRLHTGRDQKAVWTKRGRRGARSARSWRISPRTERVWPSSSTMRWARQPRRRGLRVRR